MSGWKDVLYAFPDDDGGTLRRVLGRMPVTHAINVAGHMEGFLLVGLSDTDRLVLSLSVDDIDSFAEMAPLSLDQLFVPIDRREAVEQVLPLLQQSKVHWLEQHHVSGESYAMRSFDRLWQRHALPRLPVPTVTP